MLQARFESPLGYVACFLKFSFDVISVICMLHNLWFTFKTSYYLVPPIVFSFMAHTFFYLRTIRRFSWNGTKCRFEGYMVTVVWSHLRMFLNSKFHHYTMIKCWILFKPVLEGVEGNLHFPLPSMNRLNQTERATFSILSCWALFRYSKRILTTKPFL
jgi:hypothetical protein